MVAVLTAPIPSPSVCTEQMPVQVMPGGREGAEGTTMLPSSQGKSCHLRP